MDLAHHATSPPSFFRIIKCTLNSVARAHDGGRESLKEIVSVERKGDFEDAHMAGWLGSTVLAIS